MAKLIANYQIRINGKTVGAGEEFKSDDQGLIDCGAAVLAGSMEEPRPTEASTPSEPELTDEQKKQAIRSVLIRNLAQDPKRKNKKLWTQAKTPRNSALDSELGWNATNDLVKPIFEKLLKTDD